MFNPLMTLKCYNFNQLLSEMGMKGLMVIFKCTGKQDIVT